MTDGVFRLFELRRLLLMWWNTHADHSGARYTRSLFTRHDRPSSSQVATTCEEPGNGNILVQLVPMEAEAAQFDAIALRGCGIHQTWGPCQRHGERSTIAEVDPHRVLVKADCHRRNSHAKKHDIYAAG